jgi:aminoglycoside 6'-N-acetyltransferase I
VKKTITALQPGDLVGYDQLVHCLWPDCPAAEIRTQFRKNLKGARQACFVCRRGDRLVGFIEVSLRRDYVEGTSTSPVGYIEGVYVEPGFRRQGVACKLVRRAEAWARAKGCAEMAADTEIGNRTSIAFHKKIRYREANRIVCFIKKIQ